MLGHPEIVVEHHNIGTRFGKFGNKSGDVGEEAFVEGAVGVEAVVAGNIDHIRERGHVGGVAHMTQLHAVTDGFAPDAHLKTLLLEIGNVFAQRRRDRFCNHAESQKNTFHPCLTAELGVGFPISFVNG